MAARFRSLRTVRAFILFVTAASACAGPGGHPSQRGNDQAGRAPDEVRFTTDRIVLDFGTGEMDIRGALSKPAGSAAPRRAWVWAYFINPSEDANGSRSDEPIEVQPQFSGDSALIVARGPFHWATMAEAPRTGYYARVSVSPTSGDDARVPVTGRNYNVTGATTVQTGPSTGAAP